MVEYYFCYHYEDGIESVDQVAVPEGSEPPRCLHCGNIMTFGRWTSKFENGGIILTPLII